MTSQNYCPARAIAVATGAIVAASLGGCTPLARSYGIESAASAQGVPYSLPKAMLRVAMLRNDGGVEIIVGQPQLTSDPSAPYILSYMPSSTSVDKLTIRIDNQGLLTSVSGEADDKSGEVLEALAKSFAGIPEVALAGAQSDILFDQVFDPAEESERAAVEAGLNAALATRLPASLAWACQRDSESASGASSAKSKSGKSANASPKSKSCQVARSYVAPKIGLLVRYTAYKPAGTAPATPCAVGVCTRKPNPAVLTFTADGLPFASETFMMPNGSAPVPVKLDRTAFAKSTHAMTLTQGMITSFERTKGSEALAIASAPLNIVKGVVTTAAELVQLRVNLTNNKKTLLDAEKARLEAEQALKEAREGKAATESALDDDVLIRAHIPSLGRGSGLEIAAAPALGNEGEKPPAATGATNGSAKPPAAPSSAGDAATKPPAGDNPFEGDPQTGTGNGR